MLPVLFLLCLLAPLAAAADLPREARIAATLSAAHHDGEPLRLPAQGQEFLAVHRRSTAAVLRGAVILLHDRDAHPEAAAVVRPLALGLPAHGWDTLAIQAPLAATDAPARDWEALIPAAGPRIDAALAWLSQRGIRNVVLAGYGLGARMAVARLATEPPPAAIRALVAIGMPGSPGAGGADTLTALRRLRLPVLDIYGERDRPEVLATVPQRLLAARDAANPAYTQVSVPGADPVFTGLSEVLVSRVRAWLARATAVTPLPGTTQ